MVKRGGKKKARSSTPDDGDSVTRNRSVIPILDEPDDFIPPQQQNRQNLHCDNAGSSPMMKESYDSTHSPFFLHLADHPGLSIVSHTLDGTNYNNWSIAMHILVLMRRIR